jgi:hypothetical protein
MSDSQGHIDATELTANPSAISLLMKNALPWSEEDLKIPKPDVTKSSATTATVKKKPCRSMNTTTERTCWVCASKTSDAISLYGTKLHIKTKTAEGQLICDFAVAPRELQPSTINSWYCWSCLKKAGLCPCQDAFLSTRQWLFV